MALFSKKKKLKVAIVGARKYGRLLAEAYKKESKADLVGIYDADGAAAKTLAEGLDVKSYRDLDEVLSDRNVDAVEINLRIGDRVGAAQKAFASGKHVSLASPPAADLADAERLCNAAHSAGKTYRVFDPTCYYPPTLKAKKLLDDNMIGEPQMIRVRVITGGAGGWWKHPGRKPEWEKETDGEIFFDDGFYRFGLALFLMGKVTRVTAVVDPQPSTKAGSSLIFWEHEHPQRYGFMELIYAPEFFVRSDYEPRDDNIEINGIDGNLWITRFSGQINEMPALRVLRGSVETTYGGALPIEFPDAFASAAADFASSALGGKKPIVDGDFARDSLAFALAAKKSSADFSDQPVEI